jgi:hypothetical protein
MNRNELRLRADMGWRRGDNAAFLRRLEMAKICPEFPVDRAQEDGISLRRREQEPSLWRGLALMGLVAVAGLVLSALAGLPTPIE